MSASHLEYDMDAIMAFYKVHDRSIQRSEGMFGIGWRRRGKLAACIIFENQNAHNVWLHGAAEPGGHWLNRGLLRLPFAYAFKVLGVQRISCYVDANNAASVRFVQHLGFSPEARLSGAAKDGGDVVIYVMWRRDCRYVDQI